MSQTKLSSMNIELTNKCPLKCPQCYCSLTGDKHIPLDVAKAKIKEGAEHGVKTVNLSGGETLCYPWLYELISYAASLGENVNIAISGCYFNQGVMEKLIAAGVKSISVSLNGSTEDINRLTRNGYSLAMKAIKLLGNAKVPNTYINWVMHSNNCEDFPNIVAIAEQYGISHIDIIMFKPDSKGNLASFPSGQQMKVVADFIRRYRGPVKLLVESCFSQMLALIFNSSWIGNMDTGENKGCRAGLYLYNVSVDGYYSPCRHWDQAEPYNTLDEYIASSSVIRQFQEYEQDVRIPCSTCAVQKFCRPCPAVSMIIGKEFFKGQNICEVWKFVK